MKFRGHFWASISESCRCFNRGSVISVIKRNLAEWRSPYWNAFNFEKSVPESGLEKYNFPIWIARNLKMPIEFWNHPLKHKLKSQKVRKWHFCPDHTKWLLLFAQVLMFLWEFTFLHTANPCEHNKNEGFLHPRNPIQKSWMRNTFIFVVFTRVRGVQKCEFP